MAEDIISIITKAACNVTQDYFRIKAAYSQAGIVRERVFCYELYHQIRKVSCNNQELAIYGESDKRGHRDFKKEDRKNPDFIFHIPGNHSGNMFVCEIKGLLSGKISKDFKTIITFVKKYNYQAGLFLLYNHEMKELVDKLNRINKRNEFENPEVFEKIFVVTLPSAGKIEKLTLSEALSK